MSTTTKAARKPFQRAPKDQPGVARNSGSDGPGTVAVVKASAPIEGLTIGGEPRVHLLPPQVLARKKGKAVRRRLGLGIVGVLLLVGVGTGLAEVASISAQSSLTSAQASTTQVLQQQAKYGDVLKVQSDSTSILTSQKTATTQEILWQPFITSFQKTLPGDASIGTLTAALDDAAGAAPTTSTDPLQGVHVATINASVTMKQSEVSAWLNSLPSIKGFVDATPNSVTKGTNGSYTVAMVMHIDKSAFANRFTKAAAK